MKKHERIPADDRRKQLIDAAVVIVQTNGWLSVTRSNVAKQSGMSVGSINLAFGTMDDLRNALMKHAVDNYKCEGMHKVIFAGLSDGNPIACEASQQVKLYSMSCH